MVDPSSMITDADDNIAAMIKLSIVPKESDYAFAFHDKLRKESV